MIYKVLALSIMFLFYSIYFIKMFLQKKQGIKTSQLGKGKDKKVRRIEIILSIVTFSIVPVQLLSIIMEKSIFYNSIRVIGFGIGMLGDVIFLISIITMKNSWRAGIPNNNQTNLITNGIYKISRNPAFLGFDLMYIGILMIYFNFFTFVFSLLVIVMLHFQILQEEKYLEKTFAEQYVCYKKKVFRYLGRRF